MSHPVLNARSCRNGNTAQSMVDALLALRAAADQMDKAICAVMAEPCHGRNYQTVADAERARDADLRVLANLRSANHFIDKWALDSAIAVQEAAR